MENGFEEYVNDYVLHIDGSKKGETLVRIRDRFIPNFFASLKSDDEKIDEDFKDFLQKYIKSELSMVEKDRIKEILIASINRMISDESKKSKKHYCSRCHKKENLITEEGVFKRTIRKVEGKFGEFYKVECEELYGKCPDCGKQIIIFCKYVKDY